MRPGSAEAALALSKLPGTLEQQKGRQIYVYFGGIIGTQRKLSLVGMIFFFNHLFLIQTPKMSSYEPNM